ncbi:unnamed protein product [Camellia sinensis]
MSATVKDMVMRLTSHVGAKRVVLLKHKYVDHTQIDFLRGNNYRKASVHLNRSCSRVQLARCQEVLQFSANGFTNLKPKKGKRQLESRSRSQAILTPVLDPTPTMKKLYFTGHTKNTDGTPQFKAGHTKFGTAIDGVIKIFTVAVTIVVVAVPEGLPLAVTLTLIYRLDNGEILAGQCWDIVDKCKATIFYTALTLVRSLMRDRDEYVTRYSRKSLRVLSSVGEPINPSAWRWFFNIVGDSRCPISNTWWQTETGGFMVDSRQAKVFDSKAGAELLDIILKKNGM